MFAATASFVAMQAVVRLARQRGFETTEVMFLRTAPGLPFLWLALRRHGHSLRPEQPKSLFVRSVFGSLAMSTNFTAMRALTLAQFSTLGLSQPVFVALASPLLLGERVRLHTWLAMALSFSGAFVLLDPLSSERPVPWFPAVLGLSSALFSAVAHIWVRKATESDPAERVVFHFAAWVALGSLLIGLLRGHFRTLPEHAQGLTFVLIVLGLAIFGTLGQVLMTRAYVHGEAAIVSVVGYSSVALSMLMDLAVWQIPAGPSALLGAVLMVSAGFVLVRGERGG
jgi:drug/metabolite transporter (DMT)-like permease